MTGAQGYRDRIAECNGADLGRYEPWSVLEAGRREVLGHVRRDRLPTLLAPGSPFRRTPHGIELPGDGFAARSAALAAFVDDLAARGAISRRGEPYRGGRAFDAAPFLQVDRGAVPWLGVRPYGVHLTGFVPTPSGPAVWLAVRARDKTFGGRWDNTVAGGQPLGLSLRDNLVKECGEEASIPPDLAAAAIQRTTITYVAEDATGLKPDTLFCYDLELPRGFTPRPRDGEVERFELLPAREVAHAIRDGRVCKPNCNLVWIDFCLRHGVLDDELDDGERRALAAALHAPLP